MAVIVREWKTPSDHTALFYLLDAALLNVDSSNSVGRNTVSKQDQLNAASHTIQISEDVRIVF
jgi:hypothetical protein